MTETSTAPPIRSAEHTYDGEITGIDYLTGIEYPISELIHIHTVGDDSFDIAEARYVARFCYKYGVGSTKKPPLFVTASSLETVEKAREMNVPVEIREHDR